MDEGARLRPRETWAMQTSVLVDFNSQSKEINCRGVELSEEMRAEYAGIFDSDLASYVEGFRLELAEQMFRAGQLPEELDESLRRWKEAGAEPDDLGKFVHNFRKFQILNEQTYELTSQYERARAELNRSTDEALRGFFARYAGLSYDGDGDSPQLYTNVARDDEEPFNELISRLQASGTGEEGVDDLYFGELTRVLYEIPAPVFGSMPEIIEAIANKVQAPGAVTAVGASAHFGSPLMAVVTGGSMFLLWFAKPHAHLLRDASTDWTAKKLKGEGKGKSNKKGKKK